MSRLCPSSHSTNVPPPKHAAGGVEVVLTAMACMPKDGSAMEATVVTAKTMFSVNVKDTQANPVAPGPRVIVSLAELWVNV
jgi:hypothetical protein